MSLPGQLYRLQQVDLEIQKKQETLNEIQHQLAETEALASAKSRLVAQKQRLAEAERKQREAEWDVEDLQAKTNELSEKLYSGKIKSPKELLSLEQEFKNLKGQLRGKEDELLELMSQVETMQGEVKASSKGLEMLEQEWQRKQEILKQRKVEAESQLFSLAQERQELASGISPEIIELYEETKIRKGQAVAKVEQGRCLGCYMALPTSEWQRARAGHLVQCSSCSRILFLE